VTRVRAWVRLHSTSALETLASCLETRAGIPASPTMSDEEQPNLLGTSNSRFFYPTYFEPGWNLRRFRRNLATQTARRDFMMGEAVDVALTEAARVEGSFEDLFSREYPRLVRALHLICGSVADAEDLAQEALARAYERWDTVGRIDSPVGYVYRVALNLYRRSQRRASILRRIQVSRPAEAVDGSAVETRTDVMRALQSLPLDLRTALVLREFLDMSSEESGRVMGVAPGSARARLHRARAAFRRTIGEGYE
jgi:RNA polymerase sigma factor (sigma-70 family)